MWLILFTFVYVLEGLCLLCCALGFDLYCVVVSVCTLCVVGLLGVVGLFFVFALACCIAFG